MVAVVGDLSFFHDMTGLLMTRNSEINATIVVVNNDGGGIFSFLPQAEHPAHFEKVYGTPHGLTFGSVAELYGLEYTRVSTWEEFGEAVDRGTTDIGTSIIEVPSSRERNVVLHREAWACGLQCAPQRGEGLTVALVPINGIRLNVEVHGQGMPVIMLHGFTGDLTTWRPLAAALGGRYTTVLVDLIGHGGVGCTGGPGEIFDGALCR